MMKKSSSKNTSVKSVLESDSLRAPGSKDGHKGVLPCQPREEGFYPNVDLSIWLRSCVEEVESPLEGVVTGEFPSWLSGSLLMNGPGKFNYGPQVVNHLFDGSALLQKYAVDRGRAYYMCRYVRSGHFRKNLSAHRVVTNEFMTPAVEEEDEKGDKDEIKKKGFVRRMESFKGGLGELMSDNTFITVYPLGSSYYCYYESPFAHRVDPDTLRTLARVDLNRRLGLTSNSCHPHWDERGNMFSMGIRVGTFGPEYVINKIPINRDCLPDCGDAILGAEIGGDLEIVGEEPTSPFDNAHLLAKVRARWALSPCYMHSFAMTERYFIFVEQPLTLHLPTMASAVLTGSPMVESMRWRGDRGTVFHVVHRVTGEEIKLRYKTKAFFFLHIINSYEEEGHLIVDISCYENPDMLHCMDIKALQEAQSNPDYARLFRGCPKRFVLPVSPDGDFADHQRKKNLVTLPDEVGKGAGAYWMRKRGRIWVRPRVICQVGCETPTINYGRCNGRKYRYFYAITADVDDSESAGKIYKVDVVTGKVKQWWQEGVYCAEPMFVQRPGGDSEDDGVIVSALIRAAPAVAHTALLVLDARTMTEVARAEFECNGPVPKPLHGYFTGNNLFK